MDWRPVNLQDPVSNMNGVFDIWANAIGIDPAGGKRQSEDISSFFFFCMQRIFCLNGNLRSDKASFHFHLNGDVF